MVIVLIHSNPQPGQPATQPMLHLENGTPDQAIAVLQWALQLVVQQVSGPKIHLPNGQSHVVPAQQRPPAAPPQENQ